MCKLLSSTRFLLLALCLHGPLLAVEETETFTIFSNEDKSIGEKSGADIVGPLRFAAQDVESALHIYYPDIKGVKIYVVVHKPLSDLTAGFPGKKIVIALKSDSAVTSVLAAQGGSALPPLETQAYDMQTTGMGGNAMSYWAIGGDERGAMYGGLQLAENIQFEGFTKEQKGRVAPHIMARGAKINVALDYRLPSYAGRNDNKTPSIARGIEQIWQIDFWKTWLNEQARNRLNLLSVWSYNPFPAMVNVPGFEKSTLDYIAGMSGENGNPNYDHDPNDEYKSEYVPGVNPWQNKDLTLPERQKFWREVMLYAKKRGFDFYFFNWNVCLSWVDKFYPVSVSHDKPLNFNNINDQNYLNAAIEEMYKVYPNLTGFGVSPGDQTVQGASSVDICNWIFKAYSKGVVNACKANPNRTIGFIHRGLKVTVADTVTSWKSVTSDPTIKNLRFDHSMKYCMAYTYSTETPEWSFKEMMEMAQAGESTFLTLRNDGFYYSDFGDSAFVRNFLNNLPSRKYDGKDIYPVDTIANGGDVIPGRADLMGKERLRGFYFGHDTYTPTTSYLYADNDPNPLTNLNNDPATGKPMYEIQRKWLSEMLWGRIGYDKDVDDVVFARGVAKRFPNLAKADYPSLFSAWAKSSRVNTKLQELVMDQWHFDSFFHTEFCMYKDGGKDIFRTIQMFYKPTGGKSEPIPADGSKSQLASVKETGLGNKLKKPRTSWDVAQTLLDNGNQALALLATIPPSSDKRFNALMTSIQSQAFLGLYYGYKVRGATFMAKGDTVTANRDAAKVEMYNAWGWWTHYIAAMESLYKAEDFRTYGLASLGWHYWDNAVKKEYTDLGGADKLVLPPYPKYSGSSAPIITSQPANLTVMVGQTATFTVDASGAPAPTYQWQKGTTDIPGATSVSYTTPATLLGDSGSTYRCVVTNSAGTATSKAATLTVTAVTSEPVIVTQPVSQTVTVGQTATFSVVATGNPTLTYQWKKGTTIIVGATSASYTTPAALLSHNNSTYLCVVTNGAGNAISQKATLTVTATTSAPVITTEPVNKTVAAGQTATFTVVATGSPTPTYQWQKGTTNITGATAASYTTPVTALGDSGSTYRCVVTNSAGTDTSQVATLIVTDVTVVTATPTTKPTITNETTTTPTISGTATVGSTVTIYDGASILTTLVVGPSVNWSYTVTEPLTPGSHSITYTVKEVGKTESGQSPDETIAVSGTPAPAPADSESKGGSCGLGGGLAFILFLLAGLRWIALAKFQRKEG